MALTSSGLDMRARTVHSDCKGSERILAFPLSKSVISVRNVGSGGTVGVLCRFSYRKDESVFEVGELFVALLAAEHAVLLIHHFLVAVLAGTRLVEAVLFAQEHYGGDAGEVISLKQSTNK